MLHRALQQAPRALRRSFASAATYHVPDSAKLSFRERGYAILPNFLSEQELAPIDEIYQKFMRGEVAIPGKDFCDMSQTFEAIKGKHPDEWRELLLSPRRAQRARPARRPWQAGGGGSSSAMTPTPTRTQSPSLPLFLIQRIALLHSRRDCQRHAAAQVLPSAAGQHLRAARRARRGAVVSPNFDGNRLRPAAQQEARTAVQCRPLPPPCLIAPAL